MRVVPSVLTAMTKLKAPGIEKILIEHLDKEDVTIRAAAATNLGEIKADGGAAALVAAYKRGEADLVIDTSELNVHELRAKVTAAFSGDQPTGLRVTVSSFGFKYGLPLDADMVLDVRFLPNPHWVPELRPQTGRDAPVRDYVLAQKDTARYMERLRELLEVALPGFVKEGKQYLTIAMGCTGGRHRSVVLALELADWLRESGFSVHVDHRDVERG
jgi:UPF0042 nucleotide-binding protein